MSRVIMAQANSEMKDKLKSAILRYSVTRSRRSSPLTWLRTLRETGMGAFFSARPELVEWVRGMQMPSILFRVVLMSVSMLCGATNQETFLRGNKAYQEGAYEDALAYYEQIPKKGDAVWHNMGNCCYHLNRLADARLYWERAQQCASCDDYCTLGTQLAVLDAQLGDQEQTQQNSLIFWIRSHTASYSLLLIQLVALMAWFALCIAIARRAHWIIKLTLFIFSAFFIWLSFDLHMRRSGNYAVTVEEIPLYVGPNSSYHQQGVIKQAHTVSIADTREGWYKIAYKGLAGWVQADKLIKV